MAVLMCLMMVMTTALDGGSFSKSLEQLAQSNIIASRNDMSATLWTNILSLESEHRGLDMALMDDPNPKKKAKLEEQMKAIEENLDKLKSELNNMEHGCHPTTKKSAHITAKL
jgi:hypothetical protein